MLANGWVRPRDYFRALARDCGAEFVEPEGAQALAPLSPEKSPRQALRGQVLRRVRSGRTGVALSPLDARPYQLKQRLAGRPEGAAPVSIATPRDLRETVARTLAAGLTARAVHGLVRRYPGESAAGGLGTGQKLALAGTLAGLCVSGALAPLLTLRVLAGTATLFFALVVGLRLAALRWLGAWDAFNVTEDADLGMRLYRHGYNCRVLDSETQEEAACRFGPWLRQRTRWLKGWMQTWFVHMRRPLKLWRQLGTGRFLGFHILIGGMVVSALVHPLFYLLIAADTFLALPSTLLGLHVWLFALFNVAGGYAASMVLAVTALRLRGARLAGHIVFMPVYWLMISLAAYRALGQVLLRPHHWEETEHGLSRCFARPAAAPGLLGRNKL